VRLGALITGLLVLSLLAACGRTAEPTPTVVPIPTVDPLAADPYFGDPLAGGCWTPDQVITAPDQRPQWSVPPATVIDPARSYTATVQTNLGAFQIQLLPQEAPRTVNNFVCLARSGYYDGTRFHRLVPGFVVQGGDPTGTGTGSPGYRFEDEVPVRPYARGTVAMANSGPNTNGSQFFVCLVDGCQNLPPAYNIFGTVVSGMETVDAIAAVPIDQDRPLQPVTIQSVSIAEQ
jgi:cyclophilin family peptidyl-prolyl cis-trans isomerase